MRSPFPLLLTAVVGLFGVACGGHLPGDACTMEGSAVCQTATDALECRTGVFRAVPCKGPGGCVTTSTEIQCDLSGNQVGDACFFMDEGKGKCDASKSFLDVCMSGVYTHGADCANGCTETATTVTCN